jgi:hypothetical protein
MEKPQIDNRAKKTERADRIANIDAPLSPANPRFDPRLFFLIATEMPTLSGSADYAFQLFM